MPAPRSSKRPARRKPRPRPRAEPARPKFVGRDPSPVLERYPPKEPPLRGPTPTSTAPAPVARTTPLTPPATAGAPAASSPPPPAANLIRLDRPFDVDEFSTMLGETTVRVRVPREALHEVLRRVTDFMGFGVYVYAITVRPSASASLKEFEVELERVDFVPERNRWEPFVERGSVSSP